MCSFGWHAQHLKGTRRVCSVILHGRRSIWDTLHFTLATRHYTFHSTLRTLHTTPRTLHFTLFTPHSALFTLHLPLPALYCTLRTLHFTFHTSHVRQYALHSTLYTLHSTLFTLHPLHFTLRNPHFIYPTHYILRSRPQCLYNPHSALQPIPYSTVYTRTVTGENVQTVEITGLTKVVYVISFGFIGCSCSFPPKSGKESW